MTSLHEKVCACAVAGERARGSDGAVLLHKNKDGLDEVFWVKLSEVHPDVQENLSDLLTEEGHIYIFVVQVEQTKEHMCGRLHDPT